VEGGAVIARESEINRRLALLRNFGHTSSEDFELAGINGKNSELHAAMGLCNLPHVNDIIARRRSLSERYTASLAEADIVHQVITEGCEYNYAYYPVIFRSESMLLEVVEALNSHGIQPRRYFFPSLGSLPFLPERQDTPICDSIARRVLCLPLFHTLSIQEVDMVSRLILRTLRYHRRS
jgi:dTDP-4-amino-4,6-dideoxygalactose transaminase